jgi:hypothetical protein
MKMLLVETELTYPESRIGEEELDEFFATVENEGPFALVGPNWRLPVRFPTAEELRLRDVDPDDKRHPLFRKGFTIGLRTGILGKAPDGTHLNFPAAEAAVRKPHTFSIVWDLGIQALTSGDRIEREVIGLTADQITTTVPCCGRHVRIKRPEDDNQSSLVVCCRCGVLWITQMREEMDGYSDEPFRVAVFILEETDVKAANHRGGR